ncbi:MAG: hypothetical protein JWR74_2299 [Polaromonas sp.]|nr:hypothetical protein [Polaromonas sp.]
MTTSTPATSAAFQSCIDEAHRQLPFVIDRWTSNLAQQMQDRSVRISESWERHQLQDAISILKKHRSNIERGFVESLKKVMARGSVTMGASKKTDYSNRLESLLSFDDLELMGEGQVQQAVESTRLHQHVRLGCEAGLASFSARFSTAQGFLVVKADSNPLRPEIMATALSELLQTLPVQSQTRACWLLDGGRILGEELQSFYALLNDFLASQDVDPAPYGVTVVSQAKAKVASAWPPEKAIVSELASALVFKGIGKNSEPAAAENPVPASPKPLLTLDHLHHLLMGDYEDAAHQPASFSDFGEANPLNKNFSHTVPIALDALNELEKQGLVSARMKLTRKPPPVPIANLRAQLKSDAKTLGQSLAIEVVGLMIEQMAHDERLLLPVRQIIAHAEPAFLRLAVTDPRFFSEKSHPARKLLEAITRASLGYASENEPGFAEFMQYLQALAVQLDDENAHDSERFARLLHDFERRQNRNSPEHRKAQRVAVQALLQAEQRNLLATKMAAEIRARPDFNGDKPAIRAFLTGPWAQVMAREQLATQVEAAGSSLPVFRQALGDLLWTLDVAQATRNRKRLLKMIPDLLQTLRQGLQSIDYPVDQSQPFFDELMASHRNFLRAKPELPLPPLKETAAHALGKMFVENNMPQALWLDQSEVQNSGFMHNDDNSTQFWSETGLPEPGAGEFPDKSAQPEVADKMELHLGDWVDLLVEMQWLRAELTWVSPQGTLFMFTSQGGRKHSMTSRVMRYLLKLNLIRVVSQQGVVEGALDGVARTALQNSVKGKDTS